MNYRRRAGRGFALPERDKTNSQDLRTIAIVTPKIDTFTNPTLCLLIERLLEKNNKIVFYGFEQLFIPKDIYHRLEHLGLPFNFYRNKKNINSLVKLFKQYYDLYRRFRIKDKISVVICVDPMGLVIAGRIKKLLNVKIVYASFEIFFEDEFFLHKKKVLKELETKYSEGVSVVVVQDERREKLLRSVNNFQSGTKFLRIPVSPKLVEPQKNIYDIHAELNIPRDKKIVVYSGTLQSWSGINEITNLFPGRWNNDFWLVVHSHHKVNQDDEIGRKISWLVNKGMQITLHDKAFYEFEDYCNFLSSCRIGIASYVPGSLDIFAGKNLEAIGLSSGKFSTYMMLGIPAVTTSSAIYEELNIEYNFGEVVRKIDDIPGALMKIDMDYEAKSAGCRLLYKNVLEPETKIENLLKEIEELHR